MNYIQNAMVMADQIEPDRKKIQWTHAFLIACNWLLYSDGRRVLSAQEIKTARKMYGEFDDRTHSCA